MSLAHGCCKVNPRVRIYPRWVKFHYLTINTVYGEVMAPLYLPCFAPQFIKVGEHILHNVLSLAVP